MTGSSNVYLGVGAGSSSSITSASNNIFVGAGAGDRAGNTDSNIYIGNEGRAESSPAIRIGDAGHTDQTYIAGIFGGTPGGTNRDVCVDASGKLWGTAGTCNTSSRRFKEQVADMGDSSSQVFQLRPVTFFYKPQYDDGSHLLQYGLIAEEVAKVYPDMVAYDKDGAPYTVKYQYLAPMLLNELQKQHTVVVAQQDVIKAQQEQFQTQGQQIADLQQRLSRLESLIAKR